MSINGIGRILLAVEARMRRDGHSERSIRDFHGASLARCAMALPFVSIDRRLSLADSALRSANVDSETPSVNRTRLEDEPKNPMWVSCSDCRHRWVGLYLPMPIVDAAKALKRLTCPMCASTKIFAGPGTVETK